MKRRVVTPFGRCLSQNLEALSKARLQRKELHTFPVGRPYRHVTLSCYDVYGDKGGYSCVQILMFKCYLYVLLVLKFRLLYRVTFIRTSVDKAKSRCCCLYCICYSVRYSRPHQ
jgi:hypothetical protein